MLSVGPPDPILYVYRLTKELGADKRTNTHRADPLKDRPFLFNRFNGSIRTEY